MLDYRHSIQLILISLLLSVLQISLCIDLTYKVDEGKSPGTYVGDIAVDSKIMNTVPTQNRNLVTFSQLQKGVAGSLHFFRIGKKTGKLYTAETLDAEKLCKYNKECFQIVDVAVQKAASTIKILEIKVVIIDVNDHQPQFPDKQVSIKFSEESPKGAARPIPNAVDKDVGVINSQITYEIKKV